MLKMGVIGYGGRIRGVVHLIRKFNAGAEVTAIADVRNDEIRAQMKQEGANPDAVRFYDDPARMLAREQLDGVLIGTRCSLHARFAAAVLKRNLPLYLEKPVATNPDDWAALYRAWRRSRSPVVVSFPLRMTPLVQQAVDLIRGGAIGAIQHVQAWNNVPYGECYYLWWYRDEHETQGLWLQKATHDFDYITYVLGLRPVRVAAMKSKLVYKGNMPAGLKCNDCPIPQACPESPFNRYFYRGLTDGVKPNDLACGFAKDTGNEDAGSALVEYETGLHVNYSQNFFARRGAGARGARFFGYKGTLEFDWYTDEVKVFFHHAPRTATYACDTKALGHGGGDTVLAWNFVQLMKGEAESVSPLSAGLRSALMCLKARESSEKAAFCDIPAHPGLEPDQPRPATGLYEHPIFRNLV